MKVTVLGVRGVPNVQGGVETHAEHLYRHMSELGCEIEILVRSPFVPRTVRNLGPIRITRIWSPTYPGLEALVHSFLGVIYAGFTRPDILHIHAVGPSIVAPLARLFGLRVVMTHHGPDYDRDKWGRLARAVLRTGERFGARFSHVRIAISKVIADLVKARHGMASELIPNGVVRAPIQCADEYVRHLGLEPGRYFLQVGRIVPEKRQLDLIAAYAKVRLAGWKLALVGGMTADDYCSAVQAAAHEAGVVLTGFLTGVPLQQVYSHAGVFVLPSSHEGLPIALLEALSYGLPVLASDIPANLELGLDRHCYFPVGDTDALAVALGAAATRPDGAEERSKRIERVVRNYDWERIAADTFAIYRGLLRS